MMRNNHGFTLIEVLIALAILAIAMTAMIKATTQNIKDTHYIRQKMTAHWVATYVINEIRAGIIPLTDTHPLSETIPMLGQRWTWKAALTETPDNAIQQIFVTVSLAETNINLAELTSYQYVTPPS